MGRPASARFRPYTHPPGKPRTRGYRQDQRRFAHGTRRPAWRGKKQPSRRAKPLWNSRAYRNRTLSIFKRGNRSGRKCKGFAGSSLLFVGLLAARLVVSFCLVIVIVIVTIRSTIGKLLQALQKLGDLTIDLLHALAHQ